MRKETTTSTNWIAIVAGNPRTSTIYFRERDRLSAHDRADLEAYAEVLRPYFGIPDGHRVFQEPKRRDAREGSERSMDVQRTRPRRPVRKPQGINPADHPWRGTL